MGKTVQGTAGTAGTAAGQPVAVAALVRTSTLDLQDPVASYRRQLRTMTGWLPPGWYIAAVYADVESGGTDLDHRAETGSWRVLADAGLQRDGGMADLLAEAAAPTRRSAWWWWRTSSGPRGTSTTPSPWSGGWPTRASRCWPPTSRPTSPALNATTVLVRRIKQGVAEWYRIQLKAKTRKGLEEHALAGYNNGPVP